MTVVIGSVMQALDSTVVNIAAATIGRDFHASLTSVQWVVTAYLLTLSMVILLTGWAVERFGANQVFTVSVACFITSSALCASSWSVGSLIAFRVLQGISGGMTGPVGHVILARAAGPSRVGRVMGSLGVATTLAPVFGPVVGGLLLATGSWRWIFLINVPIGLTTLVLGRRHLRWQRPEPPDGGTGLDAGGLALLAPGVAFVVYGLSTATDRANGGALGSLLPVVAGLALLGIFLLHARRLGDRALLKLRLFRVAAVRAAASVTLLGGISIYGANFLLPLFMQLAQGRSAFVSGMMLIPQGAGAALANSASGRLTDRYGAGRVVPWGLVAVCAGTAVFAAAGPAAPVALLVPALAMRGIGVGCSVVPTMAGAYSRLPASDLPAASMTVLLTQRIGGSIGTAAVATLLQYGLAHGRLGSHHTLASLSGLSAPVLHDLGPALGAAFHLPFVAVALPTALAALPALLLPRTDRPAVRRDR